MRKAKILIVMMLTVPLVSLAQDRVQAEDIIAQINAGKAVRYENAEIVGDLDFSSIEEVTADKPLRRSRWSTQAYSCHVQSEISFVNCTFRGDVLAYVHIDRKNETYNNLIIKVYSHI